LHDYHPVKMPGGKGKSIGGKGGSKDSAGKAQKSHSAKAGLQVSILLASWKIKEGDRFDLREDLR